MTPKEARELLLFIDGVTTVVGLVREKIKEARAEGLITEQDQQDRLDRIKKLLEGVD